MVKGHMGDKTPSNIISALETTISTLSKCSRSIFPLIRLIHDALFYLSIHFFWFSYSEILWEVGLKRFEHLQHAVQSNVIVV